MDSPWSNPLHLIAFEASRYLAEVFDRKAARTRRGPRRKLQEFATKDGVGTIEARVRAAIDKGNYAEANRLRTERQKLMLREAETLWRLSLEAQQRGRLKRVEARPYSPGKERWQP